MGGCREQLLVVIPWKTSRCLPSDTQECSLSLGSSSSLSLPVHIPNKSSPKGAAQLNLERRGDTSQREASRCEIIAGQGSRESLTALNNPPPKKPRLFEIK